MIKRMNKKAQETSNRALLLIVLGIVVIAIVLLGVTDVWSYITDKLNLLPDDLTSAAEACATYAGSDSFATSYCQYRELNIEDKKQFMNCNHIQAAVVRVLGEASFDTQTCIIKEVDYCTNLKTNNGANYKEKTVVNNKECGAGWGVKKADAAECKTACDTSDPVGDTDAANKACRAKCS